MRKLILLLLLVPALAGCTNSDGQFTYDPTCPSWIQSPGRPGATVESAYYKNDTGDIKRFHLDGEHIHRPTLIESPWNWNDSILDIYEWKLLGRDTQGQHASFIADGYYVFRVYAADQDIAPKPSDGQSIEWDTKDRQERLYFRDLSRPQGQQYLAEVRLDHTNGEEISEGVYTFTNKTYRIELAQANEEPKPRTIWIEYEFVENLDGDIDTPSQGRFQTEVAMWYRSCSAQ